MVEIKRIRPIGIIFIEAITLISAAWNGLRLGNVIFFGTTLDRYGAHSLYIAISSGFWLITAIVVSIGIWQRRTWTRVGTFVGLIVYILWYWSDRLFVQMPHSNWPFTFVYTLLLLAIFTFILFGKNTRVYFNLLEKNKY